MIKLFVINCRDSSSRRKFMERQLEKLGLPYEFVPAVEAKDIDRELMAQVNSREIRGGPMEEGEIACVLSHKKACGRLAQDRDCDLGVILEDDVLVKKRFVRLLKYFEEECLKGQVTLMYVPVHSPVYFETVSRAIDSYRLVSTASLSGLWGGQAYLLAPSQAEQIADSMRDIGGRADDWAWYVETGAIEGVRVVFPFPVLHAEFESDIRRPKKRPKYRFGRAALSEKIHQYKIFPLFQASLYLRRRKAEERQKKLIVIDGSSPGKTYML